MRVSSAFLLSLLTLAGGAAMLGHGLNWQPDIEAPVIESAAPSQVVRSAPSAGIEDGTQIRVLTDRPLFTAGRRPHVPEAVAAGEAEQQAAEAEIDVPIVRGIGLSGRSSVAILSLRQEESRLHRIALGHEIDGWRITSVRRQSVTFSKEATEATVHLNQPGQKPVVEIVQREPELAEEVDGGTAAVDAGQRM
ncbi:hypothetical protein SAE02_60190 [Skermanella aerolata]|uniref:Uncharacterized protein n=1 Tax=Skermanella aerolata TaxID=393310 RepID=A0A512DZH1_9PROT|nr:hypothetical protein [Skermanella aerolata]KJB90282.1 hypothetical protein N826_30250 [Skermanella aerolata KACC 11604]GEO41871.1 hypothetical protein SAE02_60190 [Skermanella aerolata]